MFTPLLCVLLLVVPLLITNVAATVPCVLGDKVPQAKSKCGALPFKISDVGGLRDPVASDANKRVKTQDPAPDSAVPSPLGSFAVVVTLYTGAIEPTIVPCLSEDLVVEAKAKLGDVPLKVREESDPAGVYRLPVASDDIRKVKAQNYLPTTAIGRPLSTSYFVGVIMYPIPPPPETANGTSTDATTTNGKQSWLWWALGAFALLLLLLALKKIFGSSGS